MKLRTTEYFVREVCISIKRNNWMSFASISTVAVSLFVLGMFLIIVLNMNRMASMLESQVQINVYLDDKLKGSEIDDLEDDLKKMQGIESVQYVSREDAIVRLRERLGDQKYLLDALGDKNPLPNAFEVTVKQPTMVETAAKAIEKFGGVESVKYGQDVGATDWFIRWPFLLEGVVLGFFGGVLASIALRSIYGLITAKVYSTLAFLPLIPQYPFVNFISLVMVLSGMGIGALGSTISLKRFLKV